MPGGALDFRVDTGGPARGVVQAVYEFELFGQRVHGKPPGVGRKPVRVDRRPVVGQALRHAERADLGQVEVTHVIAAVVARPPREARCHVGDAVEMNVVQDDQLIVTGGDNVLLEIVGAHRVGHGLRGQGVLRQVTGGASVRDDATM